MKLKHFLTTLFLLVCCIASAQRETDPLDRGLVGVPASGGGIYLSWRVQADEYYDVTYKVYRNGSQIAEGLTTSNFRDASGTTSNTYTVAAVKNGVEGEQCDAVTPWEKQYMEIPVADVQAMNGVTVWKRNDTSVRMADYTINDISLGDVDGDGKVDFIVKRKNQTDQNDLFPESNKQMFAHIECYASSIGYGRLWWIDCGPNICYGADEQWDAVAFDWNQDGKCEVLYRGGANTVLHHKNGSTTVIGNANENIRGGISHVANMTFTNSGEEWLILLNGATGEAYDYIPYPLPRGNASDWGDGYGHRSSKYFMGAPYLDGKKPYIFLGRGIYTKTDACTYQVTSGNKLEKVGNTWHSNTNAGWHGQGYHNFSIADVDEDGADEIVYGSMVLDFHTSDKSLHGMSSTGLGHGDASHTGDLDPFRKGLETFACNEDDPANNYRNAATCEIYARTVAGGDDGRSMAGNFTNDYPGGIGASTTSGIFPLSHVQSNPYSPTFIAGMTNDWNGQTPYPMALNFRIYWDGDLLSETINGPGSNESYLYIDKLGRRIFDTNSPQWSTACINSTKKNPCATGDIFGDWREELIIRNSDNSGFRVYMSNTETEHRLPSLWYDHQYRQAMVWQTEGYNQPPHPSFFVGEMEGLTQAPPPFTREKREVPYSNEIRGSLTGGKDVLVETNGDGGERTVTLIENARPSTIFLYSRTSIEGGDQVVYNETKHTFDRIRMAGYPITGGTNICKQGDAAAHLSYNDHTTTGKTDVWAGALICNGTLRNSPIWANRHSELFLGNNTSDPISLYKSIEMEYGSTLYISNQGTSVPTRTSNEVGHMSVGNLILKEGSRVVFDISDTNNEFGDKVNITGTFSIRKQNWQYGPKYLQPVFEFRFPSQLQNGDYELGTLAGLAAGSSLDNIIIEIPNGFQGKIAQIATKNSDGKYYLHIGDSRLVDASGDIVPHPTNTEVVGAETNTDTYGTVYSSDYLLSEGKSCHIEYINYNGNAAAQNQGDKGAAVVISNAAKNDNIAEYKASGIAGATPEGLDGARVAVDVYYDNGTVTYYSVITQLDGTVFTRSETRVGVTGNVVVRLSADRSHAAIDKDKSYVNNDGYSDLVRQDFESEEFMDGWVIANGGRLQGIKQTVDGSNALYLKSTLDANNNGTTATYTLPASESYNQTEDYKFSFKFGQTSTSPSSQTGNFVLRDESNREIVRFVAQPGASTGEVYVGDTKLCDYTVTQGTYFTTEHVPNVFHNVELKSTSSGTYLTVDGNSYKVSDEFQKVKSILYDTKRYAGQMIFDDIAFQASSNTMTITENVVPTYNPGKYSSVNIERAVLQPGYNTITVPFATTAEELAGPDASAYTLSAVTDKGGNNYELALAEAETILPNIPYIIYLAGDGGVPVQTVTNKMLYTVTPTITSVSGWKFVSSYEPQSVTNAYVPSDDVFESTASVKGLSAFLVAPNGTAVSSITVKRPIPGIAGKVFYLYNEESGRFLSRASSYGTRAYADEFGIPVTFEVNGGGFKVKFVDNQKYIGNTNHDWIYTDKEVGDAFTYEIESVSGKEGVYMLHDSGINNANDRIYVYVAENADKYAVATNAIIGNNCAKEEFAQWRFVNAEERNAIVAKNFKESAIAAAKNAYLDVESVEEIVKYSVAVDVTSSVTNAELRTNYDGWTTTSTRDKRVNNVNTPSFAPSFADNVGEVYEGSGNLSQTVSDLPKGLYRVSASGFTRLGSNANCVTYADYSLSNAYLEANGNKARFADWASDRATNENPNGRGAAATLFEAGKYKNVVYGYVGDDGNLTITIAQPAYLPAGWLTFRDVTVERLDPIVFAYNPETKKFLSRGDTWGMRAMTDNFGVPVQLETLADGKYRLKCADQEGKYYGDSDAMYGDKAEGTANQFIIEKHEDYLTLKNNANNGYAYVNISENAVYANGNDANAAVAKWQFLTAAQRSARISEFHDEVAKSVADAAGLKVTTYESLKTLSAALRPQDVTSTLLGTDVLNGGYTGWNATHYDSFSTRDYGNFVINQLAGGAQETYNRTTKISKTIADPGAGLYKVTIYGFYREGDQAKASDTDWNLSNAFLDVNGKKVQWASQSAGTKPAPADCATAFTGDNYSNSVFVYLNAGENMTITLGQPGWTNNGWFTFYNASITKYEATGTPEPDADLSGIIINPQFSAGATGWTINGSGAGRGQTFVVENEKATLWSMGLETKPQHIKQSSVSQIITAPADGIYKLNADIRADLPTRFFAINQTTGEPVEVSVEDRGDGTRTLYFYAQKGDQINIGVSQDAADVRITDTRVISVDNFALTYVNVASDIASIIENPSFINGTDGWEGTGPTVNETHKNAEFFNKTANMYQTIENIPNGWYTVKVQGFYRNSGVAGDAGTASKALLFANDASTYLRLLDSEVGVSPLPNSMSDANSAFDAGKYENEVKVYVYDNKLTFGLKKETSTTNDWLMFDNFRLEYSATNDDNDRTQYITDPSFETSVVGTYWQYMKNPSDDTRAALNSDPIYTISNNDKNYVFNTWTSSEGASFGLGQDIVGLPKGVYTLSAVLASDQNNTISINVNDGYQNLSSTMTSAKANGQQAEIAQIVVREDGDTLHLNVTSDTWFKADNFRLTYTAPVTDDVIKTDALDYLNRLVAKANIEKAEYVAGLKMFDYKSDSPALTSINGAITSAGGVNSGSALEDIDTQISNMIDANQGFVANKSSIDYNGPDAELRYNIKFGDVPVTFVSDNGDKLNFGKNLNVNYTQAFMLEKDEILPRSYKLSFIDAEGNKQYLATTSDAGEGAGDDYKITVTTNPSKALAFTVERSAGYSSNDVVYLRNPKLGNNYLNRLGDAFKTGLVSDGKGDIKLTVASKAEPQYKVGKAAEWGTFIAPFAVDVPVGSEAYTVTGISEGELLLEQVQTTIPANTPVVLKNVDSKDVTLPLADYGTASQDLYGTDAYLVGSYSNANLPVSNETTTYYILQRQGEETSFFKISKDRAATPYRCYLAVSKADPEVLNARLRFPLFDSEEDEPITGVEEINFNEMPLVKEVYSTSGVRLPKMRKGINVVRLGDGTLRKVYIK